MIVFFQLLWIVWKNNEIQLVFKNNLIYFLIFRRYWTFFLNDKSIFVSTKNSHRFCIVEIQMCRKENYDTIWSSFKANENSCMKN